MSLQISVQREVDAPADAAWAVVDDFANIANWTSSIQRSELVGDSNLASGLGAERVCELGPGKVLEERIVEYTDGERLTIDVYGVRGLPVKSSLSTFTVSAKGNGRSTITFDAEVVPKMPAFIVSLLRPVLTKRFSALQVRLLDEWAAAAEARSEASV